LSLLNVFSNAILPVILVFLVGYVVQRTLAPDIKSVARVAFYVFTPCVIFSSLFESTLGANDAGGVLVFLVLNVVILWAASWGAARVLRLSQRKESAFLLSILLDNCGNFGLPVLLFAYGQAGMTLGSLYFAGSVVLTNTLGVYLASRGSADVRSSVRRMARVPVVYAVALALLLKWLSVAPPQPLLKAIDLLGDAGPPTMELLLGMQLAHVQLGREWKLLGAASALRLLGGAVVGVALAALLGLRGLTRKVCVVESSMPSAITATVVATEFDSDPTFVTGVVFITTLLSMVSLSIVLRMLI
jgi:malate permease and related proteins